MARPDPCMQLLRWLEDLPLRQRHDLARRYIILTSSSTADFSCNGEEAWRLFERELTAMDLPLRRVARLLAVRGLFTFLLESQATDSWWVTPAAPGQENVLSFDSASFLRACKRWRALTQAELSDNALREWLLEVQGEESHP